MRHLISHPRVQKALRVIAKALKVYALLVVGLTILYWIIPPVSTLMVARLLTFNVISYHPVSLSNISPNMQRAVLRAEDGHFCDHAGVDWGAIEYAVKEGKRKKKMKRGASTIPMQVAKNLFLWPQQSYIRKAVEIPLAMFLDGVWSKRRMLEIYLSVAEWGKGIFGVEAAAQHYFKKPAKNLTLNEASLLVAALPSPKTRNPARPTAYHRAYARSIAKWSEGADLSCLK